MDNGEDYDTADGKDNGREELYCATYPTVGRLVDSTTITAAISCVCVMVARRCGRVVVVDVVFLTSVLLMAAKLFCEVC